ncbi:MAG TPA: hypothetical protein VL463_04150 [Kofleriaceae bacterium]|nr:hypothetical protein [Kofleriaceae bacterium]
MRTSISFLTTTSATAPLARIPGLPHTLDVLGFDREHRTIYFAESVGAARIPVLAPDAPDSFVAGPASASTIVHVMHVDGEHAGRMIVASSQHGRDVDAIRARLSPLDELESDAYLLTTRVIQRRALRVPGSSPIRKFTLALSVEPIVGDGDPRFGRAVVTAYLRAKASLDRVWLVPGTDLVLARVTYLGVPSDVGHDKQVAVLTQRAA